MSPERNVPLAPCTTLGVGGAASWMARVGDEDDLRRALDWAERAATQALVLGGGSNLVVADGGVDALVVHAALRGVAFERRRSSTLVVAGGGELWDELVRACVQRRLAGLEALSGIPGCVGATPIQNVGAYGQDVSQSLVEIRVVDRTTGALETLPARDLAFGYRDSRLKSAEPNRFVVVSATFELVEASPVVRYSELAESMAKRGLATPSVADVRDAVLALRRGKSMVLDPGDPNRRSCGSFFVNPIVGVDVADRVVERSDGENVPRWIEADGRVKLAAGWLIERSGLGKGLRDGAVGISTNHALALVAHDGATARDVVRLARRVRGAVEERFGVRLVPEPVFWGFGELDGGLPVGG